MITTAQNSRQHFFSLLIFSVLLVWLIPGKTYAHCDSYDGPVIQDALRAIESNDVDLVLKWVEVEYEAEIIDLFGKVLKYKPKGGEVYEIVEKHFLETLVRLHREGEGAAYTGLKSAGSTAVIISMTDASLIDGNIDAFMKKFHNHLDSVIREKYNRVVALQKVKENSVEEGRAYVAAYVDYTHTVEALHDIVEHGISHQH